MKHYELKQIVEHFKKYKTISYIKRVDTSILNITFDKEYNYFIDLNRDNSHIFKKKEKENIKKKYNSPFDVILEKLISFSEILKIEILNKDRIIRFSLSSKNKYKIQKSYFQCEFTGRNPNAIILNENNITIEALRNIDEFTSFRVVKTGVKLINLPPYNNYEKEIKIKDIDNYLIQIYNKNKDKKLIELKKNRLNKILKKYEKLQKVLSKLETPSQLLEKSKTYKEYANYSLMNLSKINHYDKFLIYINSVGKEIKIELPKGIVVNRIAEYFFKLSKQNKNKSKHIYLEQNNLNSKINFYKNIYSFIEKSKSIEEIISLFPAKNQVKNKKNIISYGEIFWIGRYKILIGRNQKENQKIVEIAKANDIWMHIKGIPSSHLIIKSDKQQIPESIIQEAGKICVEFSTQKSSKYEVDYTKRKFVKLKDNSNVLYSKYKTILVNIN